MLQYITDTLQQVSSTPLGLVFAMLLGVVSAATSACCTLPALGLVVGYSGAEASVSRKAATTATLFFMLGTIVSLMILGAVSGFVGQVAQSALGRYWRVFAGIVAIFMGLVSLKLLRLRLSRGEAGSAGRKLGRIGPVLAGLVLGGIVAVSSLPCNPGIFIVIGAAILQGAVVWASLLLGMFAIGFAVPLGGVILGISLGRASIAAKGADRAIRWIAGLILIAVGFYFLITF